MIIKAITILKNDWSCIHLKKVIINVQIVDLVALGIFGSVQAAISGPLLIRVL